MKTNGELINVPGLGKFKTVFDIQSKLLEKYGGMVSVEQVKNIAKIFVKNVEIVIMGRKEMGPKVSVKGGFSQLEKKKTGSIGLVENVKWLLGKVF